MDIAFALLLMCAFWALLTFYRGIKNRQRALRQGGLKTRRSA
jgi:hypothetical protein